jgi:hypothetical protein
MGNGTLKGSTLGLRSDVEAARRERGIESVPSGRARATPPISPIFKNFFREIFNPAPSAVASPLFIGPSSSNFFMP